MSDIPGLSDNPNRVLRSSEIIPVPDAAVLLELAKNVI